MMLAAAAAGGGFGEVDEVVFVADVGAHDVLFGVCRLFGPGEAGAARSGDGVILKHLLNARNN